MMLEHEIEFRVRYQETDAMGIAHHANYFTWFEIGRSELLRAGGVCYRDLEAEGTFMVVVRIGCRYHRPARYDDLLRLRTRTVRISAAKIEHEYRLWRGDELLAVGQSTLACVDRDGQLQRTPQWMRTE